MNYASNLGFYQPEARVSPRAPGSSRNFTGGWPHCVSPLGGLGTFSRAWFKDSCSAVLGLMDRGTKALKEENHLGSKSSDNERYVQSKHS